MGTLSGEATPVIFIAACHIKWGYLMKDRICFPRSKFFPVRVDPTLGRLRPSSKQTGSHANCLFENMAEKDRDNPYTLNSVTH